MNPWKLRLLDLRDRLQPYTVHLTVLATAGFLGMGMGLTAVFSEPVISDSADRWSLPKWAPYREGGKRAELQKLAVWSEDPSKKPVEAPKPVAPWRFVGIVEDGDLRLAVIEVEGRKIQRVAAGDGLPNGGQVVTIGAGELTYRENEVEKTLTLFNAEKTAPSN